MSFADERYVGEKIISVGSYGRIIGTVVKITDKRKDITVDFGGYTIIYDNRGWQKSRDSWHRDYLQVLTPEIEKEIEERKIIQKCIDMFKKAESELTAKQAEAIITLLEMSPKTT